MLEPRSFDQGTWLNPPAISRLAPHQLMIETDAETDFWRQTHYGFTHANGHALLFDMPQTFVAETTFQGRFSSKYEQAGLLLWENDRRWIKAGIENADGRANLAVVVTDGRSDWSLAPTGGGEVGDGEGGERGAAAAEAWTIRMTATDTAVIVHARGAAGWQILRVANFICDGARVGPMACSPLNAGLQVHFSNFRTGPVPQDPLYLSD